jgi:hypothetical protein
VVNELAGPITVITNRSQTGELVYANNFNVRLLHSLPVAAS